MDLLSLRFASGLEVALADPHPDLARAVRAHFRPHLTDATAVPPGALLVTAEPPPPAVLSPPQPLAGGPGTLRRADDLVVVELGGATAWCEPDGGRAGILVGGAGRRDLELLVALAFTSLVFELALARGFLGLHAAAVAPGGRGVLLPGPSGAGKTTTLRGAHRAGMAVLSDDLVWVTDRDDGPLLHAFERGRPSEPVPPPTLASAPLAAIVCPTIVPAGPSRLVPVPQREAARVLLGESGFLGGGPAAAARFRAVVRLAGRVPAYRLLAGPDRAQVPPLLAAAVGGR